MITFSARPKEKVEYFGRIRSEDKYICRSAQEQLALHKTQENTDGCGQRKTKSPLFPELLTKGRGQTTMWEGEQEGAGC